MFSSKSFIVPGLTFRLLIHFEFLYVNGVKCSNFILLHVAVQFSQHCLLKRLSLPQCIFLSPVLFHWSIFLFLQSTDFYATGINLFLVGKSVLIVMVPILIHKDEFESSYTDLNFVV